MIPQSRTLTTRITPWPQSSRMLSSIRPFSYSFSPEKIPETSQSLEIRAVSPALSYPPFILSSLRNFYSFPVPPGFFQKLPLSPLPRPNILLLSSHPKPIRHSVPVPAPAPAQNRCRSYKRRLFQSLPLAVPPRLFLFPFPASAGSQVDGKWPFLRLRFPSALCLLQPSAGIPPLSSPFALKTPRLPRPHLAACQSPSSLSHRLEIVSFFSKIAAFSFFSGKTTKNLADSIEFFYSKFFQKAMLSPDNRWKSVAFSV